MRLVHGGQRERLRSGEWEALDRRIHSMAMLAAAEREVAKRIKRWRRRRWIKVPGLWFTASVAALLAWWGRR
jgi:hypothetical protein